MAASFNGTNQHIRTWYQPTWLATDPFTICCWMRTMSFAQGCFFGAQNTATTARFGLFLADSGGTLRCQVRFYDDGNAGTTRTGDVVVNDNTWRHVAVVRDPVADTINLYLNGVLDASASGSDDTTGTCTLGSRDLALGSNHTGTTWSTWLTCQLEDVGVWSSALTTAQVQALAADTRLHCPAINVGNLLRHWPLQGLTGLPVELPAQLPVYAAGPITWPSWGFAKAVGTRGG